MSPLASSQIQEFLQTYDHDTWAREFLFGKPFSVEACRELFFFLGLTPGKQTAFVLSAILPYYQEKMPAYQAREVAEVVAARNAAAVRRIAQERKLIA